MQKVIKLRGAQLWLFMGAAVFLLLTAFPLFLLFAAIVAMVTLLKTFFSTRSDGGAFHRDPNMSGVIRNEKIGPYRIRKSNNDPDIIEVVDDPNKE